MAVTGYWYPNGLKSLATGLVSFVADSASIKCALMNANFTGGNQSLSLADYWNDISAYECSAGGGYTSKTVGTTAVAVTSTSNKTVKFSGAASTVFTTLTHTTRGAVVYKALAAASDSPVLFFLDWGADQSPSAGDFTITWNTDGMATIVAA
jgi:hypothetical protein